MQKSGLPLTSEGSDCFEDSEENLTVSKPEVPVEMSSKIKSLTSDGIVRNPFAVYVK